MRFWTVVLDGRIRPKESSFGRSWPCRAPRSVMCTSSHIKHARVAQQNSWSYDLYPSLLHCLRAYCSLASLIVLEH
eukprot:5952992-Alexandrium_andersonii.AAC.1